MKLQPAAGTTYALANEYGGGSNTNESALVS
jgi:hypothetical protein